MKAHSETIVFIILSKILYINIFVAFSTYCLFLFRFYYYGSTRGQKNKSSQKAEPLTPRPLLPSQRALGGDTRLGPSPVPPKVSVLS